MTLTTERMAEIAKLAIRMQQISGCAAVTSSGETIMHHTFVDTILSALHDVTAELLANREAQPVVAAPIYQILDDGDWCDTSEQIWRETYDDFRKEQYRIVYTAPPAPAVVKLPTEFYSDEGIVVRLEQVMAALAVAGVKYERKGGACRAAMLAESASSGYTFNSPVIPDGWKLVPVDLTPEMLAAWDSAPNCGDDDTVNMMNAYREMLAAAPEGGNDHDTRR